MKKLTIHIDPIGLNKPTRWDVSLREANGEAIPGMFLTYFDTEYRALSLKRNLEEAFKYMDDSKKL